MSLRSETEDGVPSRANADESISVGRIPVRFRQPVVGGHPNVQDLGVSTRHGESEEEGDM